MFKFFWRHFISAVAATYNFSKRYRELLRLEDGDIVIQTQYPERGFGPWKIVGSKDAIDFRLRNPKGEEIVVYRGHISKAGEGLFPKQKAKW